MLTIAPQAPPQQIIHIIDRALSRYFRGSPVTFRLPDGLHHYGSATPQRPGPVITFRGWTDILRLATNPSWVFGVAYTEGRVTAGPEAIDEFMMTVTRHQHDGPLVAAVMRGLHYRPPNWRGRQQSHITDHYDGERQWYDWVLGKTRLYTCAFYPTGTEGLDTAQHHKIELVARKLGLRDERDLPLRERSRLLDVGCGFGYIACTLALHYGVRVHGVTLSRDQYEGALKWARELGIGHLVSIDLLNYQDYAEQFKAAGDQQFDAIYSVGMAEHVRHADYGELFRLVRVMLKPGGPFLLHCITNQLGGPPNSWIAREVFPGSRLGAEWQFIEAGAQSGFVHIHSDNLYSHYARTCRLWLEAHRLHRDQIVHAYGEQFYRQRELWLTGCVAEFTLGGLGLCQMLFSASKSPAGASPWSYQQFYPTGQPEIVQIALVP